MPHIKTILTESELKDYLREHVGVKPTLAELDGIPPEGLKGDDPLPDSVIRTIHQALSALDPEAAPLSTQPKKKRGRPFGSRNKPKAPK